LPLSTEMLVGGDAGVALCFRRSPPTFIPMELAGC
jgi:hypothetical protein